MIIDDGTGRGYKTEVDSNNRIHTMAVTQTESLQAISKEDGYNINTGEIAFTAAGSLLYIKNNEDKDLVVQSIAVGVNNLGTHSDIGRVTIKRNITGGDLITDATAVAMNANRHFGSSNAITADIYAGKSGGTATGGDDIILFFQAANGRLFASIDLVVPKGQNIAITIDPKLSSGTATVYGAAVCYLQDPSNL